MKLESNLLWGLYFHLLSVTLHGSNWCAIINNGVLTRGGISKRLYFNKQFRQLWNKHKGITKPTVLHNSPVPAWGFFFMNGSWPGFCLMCLSEALLKLLFSISTWTCWNVSILMKIVSFFFSCRRDLFYHLKIMSMYVGMSVWVPRPTETRGTRVPPGYSYRQVWDAWPRLWVSNSSTL